MRGLKVCFIEPQMLCIFLYLYSPRLTFIFLIPISCTPSMSPFWSPDQCSRNRRRWCVPNVSLVWCWFDAPIWHDHYYRRDSTLSRIKHNCGDKYKRLVSEYWLALNSHTLTHDLRLIDVMSSTSPLSPCYGWACPRRTAHAIFQMWTVCVSIPVYRQSLHFPPSSSRSVHHCVRLRWVGSTITILLDPDIVKVITFDREVGLTRFNDHYGAKYFTNETAVVFVGECYSW